VSPEAPAEESGGQVIDLMEALRTSLSANSEKREARVKTAASKTQATKRASPADVEALAAKPRRPVKRAAPKADVKEAPPAKVRAGK
jgi:DNA end-binding protein Ku